MAKTGGAAILDPASAYKFDSTNVVPVGETSPPSPITTEVNLDNRAGLLRFLDALVEPVMGNDGEAIRRNMDQ